MQEKIDQIKDLRRFLALAEYSCLIDHQDKYKDLLSFTLAWFNFPKTILIPMHLKKRIKKVLFTTIEPLTDKNEIDLYTRRYYKQLKKPCNTDLALIVIKAMHYLT